VVSARHLSVTSLNIAPEITVALNFKRCSHTKTLNPPSNQKEIEPNSNRTLRTSYQHYSSIRQRTTTQTDKNDLFQRSRNTTLFCVICKIIDVKGSQHMSMSYTYVCQHVFLYPGSMYFYAQPCISHRRNVRPSGRRCVKMTQARIIKFSLTDNTRNLLVGNNGLSRNSTKFTRARTLNESGVGKIGAFRPTSRCSLRNSARQDQCCC